MLRPAFLMAALILTGCQATAPPPRPAESGSASTASPSVVLHALSATMAVPGFVASGGTCTNDPGFAFFGAGTRITIHDDAGTVISTGTVTADAPTWVRDLSRCRFRLVVSDVPDAVSYLFEVAHVRGPKVTRAVLEAAGWKADLELGER